VFPASAAVFECFARLTNRTIAFATGFPPPSTTVTITFAVVVAGVSSPRLKLDVKPIKTANPITRVNHFIQVRIHISW
jgi:hypothetical protein